VGLTQLGAREYDPTLGRFLSVDPVADPNDAQQLHGYTYADNNPITKSDPDGQIWGWLKAVGNGLKAAGNGLANAWNATTKWVDDHRSWLGVAAGVLAIVGSGGTLGVVATLVGTALTMRDMWIATKNHDRESMALDALSFGFGGAAAGVGRMAEDTAKLEAAAFQARNTSGVLSLPALRASQAPAKALENQADALNVESLAATTAGPYAQGVSGGGWTNNPDEEGIGGGKPAAAPPTDWSCSRPGFYGPYPCTNRQGNPMANSYCHAGGVFCVLPPRALAGPVVPRFTPLVPLHHSASYNLGPDKPGPNRQTYNSPEAIRTGIYQTSDGFLHLRNRNGVAFF
jgi:hypothetical protein